MTGLYTMLVITITFWLVLSVGGWWQKKSWFPFTVIMPIALIVLALAVNKFFPGWGNAAVIFLHVILWLLLVYVFVTDVLTIKNKK